MKLRVSSEAIRNWPAGGSRGDQDSGQLSRINEGCVELTVGVGGPWGSLGAGDVLRERVANDGGVAGGVEFGNDIDTTLDLHVKQYPQ